MIERVNKEVKRRSRVVGAILIDINEVWWFSCILILQRNFLYSSSYPFFMVFVSEKTLSFYGRRQVNDSNDRD